MDKSTSWERLSDMKESYPVEVAEYEEAVCISNEPAVSWSTAHALKKGTENHSRSQQKIPQVDTQIWDQGAQNCGGSCVFGQGNGYDLWWKAIQKQISAVEVAFKVLDEDERPPVGSQYMKCHMMFSIKMEDFSQKAHLVAGGHMVEAPMQESFRIALTLAALNDLEVKTSYIQNADLTAPCSDKVHTTHGTESGENEGKTAMNVRALYGLASSG